MAQNAQETCGGINQRFQDFQRSLLADVTALQLELANTKAALETSQRQLLGSDALVQELSKKLNTAEQEIDVLKGEKQAAERKLLQTQNELVAKDDELTEERKLTARQERLKPMMMYPAVWKAFRTLEKEMNEAPRHRESRRRAPPSVTKRVVRRSAQTQLGSPKKIDGTKPGAAGEEGVLGKFFNSLQSTKAGNNNPASPARPGEQPNNIPPVDKAVVRSYAAAELDTPTRNMK